MRKLVPLLALAAAFAAGPASAAPNFLGPTGLILAPNADVVGRDAWNAHVHGTSDFFTLGANVGLGDRLELGATWFDPDNGDEDILFNGKFALLREDDRNPGLAFGALDIFDELDRDVSWYVVASKRFAIPTEDREWGLRGHLGYGGGFFDDEIFAGLELAFRENVALMADFVDDDINLGARVGLGQNVRLDLALLDDVSDFGAGLSYIARFR